MTKYIRIPIDEVQKPKDGMIVIKNHYWLVENGNVLGFEHTIYNHKSRITPQCNKNKIIVENALKRKPEQDVVFLEVAYWCY